MTYDTYRIIFLVAAILAGVCLVASVLIFILLKIPSVIGDLSGATARKAIDEIRNGNEKTGAKAHKESNVNKARGKLTDKISQSGSIEVSQTSGFAMGTAKISTVQLSAEAKASVAGTKNETTVLEQSNETTVLGQGNETTVLGQSSETTVLGQSEAPAKAEQRNETTVLSQNGQTAGLEQSAPPERAIKNDAVEETQQLGGTSEFNKTVTLAKAPSESGNTSELSSANNANTVPHTFEILYDITIVNTQEIIC